MGPTPVSFSVCPCLLSSRKGALVDKKMASQKHECTSARPLANADIAMRRGLAALATHEIMANLGKS
jgi:hypothetical protein